MNSFPRMHVSLYVADIEKTRAFYEAFFDQPADKYKSDYAKFILEQPSLIISFVQNPSKVGAGFGHLGFQLETQEQLVQKLEWAREKQLIHLEEMGVNCCYAAQDKFWVQDPDGYMWEVYYFHQDVAFNDPRYASQDAVACCTPPAKKKVSLADLKVINACDPASGCC